MIRNLLATAAIATFIATGALAQSSTPTPPSNGEKPGSPVPNGPMVTDNGTAAGGAAQH